MDQLVSQILSRLFGELDTRLKNNYFKLKISILLQTLLITALTVLIGSVVLNYVVDGIYNDAFRQWLIELLTRFLSDEIVAEEVYSVLIEKNKYSIIIVGYFALFAVFFYVTLSKMTRYLNQVEEGIENIVSDSMEPVQLITELSPIEDRLNEIKMTIKRQEMEALESERKKNELVVFLAHDLKTPLTSIVAYLTILETRPDMPMEERAKYTRISLEKAIRLGELINEFFEITKFNLQDIILEKSPLDLSLMIEQIADEIYGVLRQKQLTCTVEVDETLFVNGDADKLARVFDNILRNAVSYCYENTEIHIQAMETESHIKIVFANEGKRIPEDQLYSIFEKFYRMDDARSSITGGAGLGLAISKETVELHGGYIYAESDDVHTRFIVLLPKADLVG